MRGVFQKCHFVGLTIGEFIFAWGPLALIVTAGGLGVGWHIAWLMAGR